MLLPQDTEVSKFRGFHRGCWRAPSLDPDHLEVSHVVLRMILIRGHSREHCLSFLSNTTINQPQPQPQNTQNAEHRTQNTDPHKNTQNTNMRTFSISWCRCFYCCCTNCLVPPFTSFCNVFDQSLHNFAWMANKYQGIISPTINVLHFWHNVFLHWLHLYGCGSVAGGGRATIKELSDQSGVNCLARWSKYSAQDLDHNIQDQYTRPIYKTNIQDQ